MVALHGAAHTAAGDDNDAFSAAVVGFCTRPGVLPEGTPPLRD